MLIDRLTSVKLTATMDYGVDRWNSSRGSASIKKLLEKFDVIMNSDDGRMRPDLNQLSQGLT